MAGDIENPRVWLEGDAYVGDIGATLPTNVSSDWDADWDALGILGDDGLTEARDEESNDLYGWGIFVRTVRSKHKRTFTINVLEDTPIVFDLVNPGSTAETAGEITTREVIAPQPNPKAFGFERRDGDIISRIIVDRGEVTEVGDITSNEEGLEMRELTITAYPDADTGLIYTEVTNNPAAAESGS